MSMLKVKAKKNDNILLDISGKIVNINNTIHEGAGSGRSSNGLSDISISPTDESVNNQQRLINRTHGILRNDAWVHKAVKSDSANEIGTGIKPSPKSPYKKFNKDILELWNDFMYDADYNGVFDVYGLQLQAVNARKSQGGVFIRAIRSEDKPIQWQLLEYIYCPFDEIQSYGDNSVRYGFEFDSSNKIVAYWLYSHHPDDSRNTEALKLIRVPADQIIHHYLPTRAGALRASPEVSRAINKANMLSKYDHAELTRKENRASFTGVIRRDEYSEDDYNFDPISGLPLKEDVNGVGTIELEAGTFPSLLAGEDITLFNGDTGNDGYLDFQKMQLQALAASTNVPYQLLSGDYNGVNDRALRVVLNQYRREVTQNQELITIHQVCRVMWNQFVDDMVLKGYIKVRDYAKNRRKYIRCDHIPDAFEYIHPLQDIQALKLAVDEGFRSRKEVVESRNRDINQIDTDRKSDLDREIDLGIARDVDGNELDLKKVDEFYKGVEDEKN